MPKEVAKYILINPAHGNEPYLLGVSLGLEVGKQLQMNGMSEPNLPKLVVPLMYGQRQLRILREEFPDAQNRIIYDEQFGEMLAPTLMNDQGYPAHLRNLATSADKVEANIQERFSKQQTISSARSLATNEEIPVDPREIGTTIDVGSRISTGTQNRYFAFPVLLSELLEHVTTNDSMPISVDKISTGPIVMYQRFGFSKDHLQTVKSRMRKIEAGYRDIFIPLIHTLSAPDISSDIDGIPFNPDSQQSIIDGKKRIYTPPLKHELQPTKSAIDNEGIYIMYSGTGMGLDGYKHIYRYAPQSGYALYTQTWAEIGKKKIGRQSPKMITDENIVAIAGRSGWGTGWQAMSLGKPWLVTPYQSGDDPEIWYNNLSAVNCGVASELHNLPELYHYGAMRLNIKGSETRAKQIRSMQKRKFGTLDGIVYVAKTIAAQYSTL